MNGAHFMPGSTKPRLVFFRWPHEGRPAYIHLHLQQHVRCLNYFFDLTVIDSDCDYREICDAYQPDLTLFECGDRLGNRQISNTAAHPQVPKVGFCHSDAYSDSRAAFISRMAHWGIETFFSLSIPMAEYTPEIAENLFVWPNFVDTELYRDYGQSKVVPVLLTGSAATHYPWRRKINKLLAEHYPSLICPHFGWGSDPRISRMTYGEAYARMLNASWFVPACGGMARELVRKHLEVPACKACLITERTPALEAAGFVNGENCIFADDGDVLDKLEQLFQDQQKLQTIIDRGYKLVRSRHTMEQRDQLFQWFTLNRNLRSDQKIIQTGAFGDLCVVNKSSGIQSAHIIGNGLDRALLREGDDKLWAGRYGEAETLYLRCVNYYHSTPEPRLRLAICNLNQGRPADALHWLAEPIKHTLEAYHAPDPDPVEWAYFIISLLCHGELDRALRNANRFPLLYHPELELARTALAVLAGKKIITGVALPAGSLSPRRYSVHELPNRTTEEWAAQLCRMLRACHQDRMADALRKPGLWASVWSERAAQVHASSADLGTYNNTVRDSFVLESELNSSARRILSKGKSLIIKLLHRLENRFGCFLPYRFSLQRDDEFLREIRKLMREEDVSNALVIGAAAGASSTEAVLAGARENLRRPMVICANTPTAAFRRLQGRYRQDSSVRCCELGSSAATLEKKCDCFDVVLLDGPEIADTQWHEEAYRARFVLLDHIKGVANSKRLHRLVADPNYLLIAHNPDHRSGYAIFKRMAEAKQHRTHDLVASRYGES